MMTHVTLTQDMGNVRTRLIQVCIWFTRLHCWCWFCTYF